MSEPRDVALGLAVVGAEVGMAAGRAVLAPMRLVARAPLVGGAAHRVAEDLAHQGALARARLDVETDALTDAVARLLASSAWSSAWPSRCSRSSTSTRRDRGARARADPAGARARAPLPRPRAHARAGAGEPAGRRAHRARPGQRRRSSASSSTSPPARRCSMRSPARRRGWPTRWRTASGSAHSGRRVRRAHGPRMAAAPAPTAVMSAVPVPYAGIASRAVALGIDVLHRRSHRHLRRRAARAGRVAGRRRSSSTRPASSWPLRRGRRSS